MNALTSSDTDAEPAPLLLARQMGKRYPGVLALDRVDFALRAGEVHALMGENGAGKSTLMKILAGIVRRDAGQLWLGGQAVDFQSAAQAQAHGVAIVHQELNLMPHLTVAQNIWLGREPRRWGLWMDDAALLARTQAHLAALQLPLDPLAPVQRLSIAAQQLVEIAKALTQTARVLILDEPTAALNPHEVQALFEVVRRLRDQGVGVVYISHKMDEIQRIADRITVMRDGRSIATLPASTPLPKLVALMVGREVAETAPLPKPAQPPRECLRVQGLRRGRAVQDVGFALHAGEILGFAGLMGAGRTELARLIFGADRREAGQIWVQGRPCPMRSPQDAVHAGVAYLPEDRKQHGLAIGMSVEANITLASLRTCLRGGVWLAPARLAQRAREGVHRLRIKTPSIEQTVQLLSGGNQQKVVMAKWLLSQGEVLIFDEPTRGIDVGAKADIHQLIRDLAAQGKAVIVISSELPEVLALCHRILVMKEGRITGELHGPGITQAQLMHLATLPQALDPT